MADKGIYRFIKLFLDKQAASAMERDAQKALDQGTDPKKPNENLSHISKALGSLKTAAIAAGSAVAAAFAFNKIKDFTVGSIKAAAEADEVWTRLSVTLKNFGASSRIDEIQKKIGELTQSTTFDDEALAGAFNVLLQRTKSVDKAMSALGATTDLATGLTIDLKTASDAVGKALTGNFKTLQQLTDKFKEGDDVVSKIAATFGGQAAEAAVTFSGKLKQLSNEWDNFREELGKALIEAGQNGSILDTLKASVVDMTSWMVKNGPQIRQFADEVLYFAGALVHLAKAVGDMPDPQKLGKQFRAWVLGGLGINEGPKPETIKSGELLNPAVEQAIQDIDLILAINAQTAARKKRAAGGGGAPGKPGTSILDQLKPELAGAENFPLGKFEKPGAVSIVDQVREQERQQDELHSMLVEKYRATADDILNIMQSVGFGIEDAFHNAFDMVLRDFDSVGAAAGTLGRGIAGALIGGMGQYAQTKSRAAFLDAASEVAEAIIAGVTPGRQWEVGGHLAGAAKKAAVGAGWAALAGTVGATAGRVAGSGGGYPSGGGAGGTSQLAAGIDTKGPEIHIHVDGVDPSNARHQELIGEAARKWTRRAGARIIFEGA